MSLIVDGCHMQLDPTRGLLHCALRLWRNCRTAIHKNLIAKHCTLALWNVGGFFVCRRVSLWNIFALIGLFIE